MWPLFRLFVASQVVVGSRSLEDDYRLKEDLSICVSTQALKLSCVLRRIRFVKSSSCLDFRLEFAVVQALKFVLNFASSSLSFEHSRCFEFLLPNLHYLGDQVVLKFASDFAFAHFVDGRKSRVRDF